MLDWSKFEGLPESTCTCQCGTEFRSHAKMVVVLPDRGLVSRKPCPKCQSYCMTKAASDPEYWVVERKDMT